jgi:ElaB/YqjD/DUF883 family membrane-anchored ribosome-binding protein
MSLAPNTTTDFSALQDDLAALKRDVAGLVSNLSASASKGAEKAASQLDENARQAYRDIAAKGGEAMKGWSHQIEEQPVLALLIALGIGYIGGRVLSR